MYRKQKVTRTKFNVNESVEGETIEQKIERITQNREPITDASPMYYTERKDGIRPEYDIRTDRFEIAVDAMDKATKGRIAKRESNMRLVDDKDGKAEPGHGQANSPAEGN